MSGISSPPSSSVNGIFQARILKWVATSFSRGFSQPRYRTWGPCIIRRLLIAGRFFTNCVTREAPLPTSTLMYAPISWSLRSANTHTVVLKHWPIPLIMVTDVHISNLSFPTISSSIMPLWPAWKHVSGRQWTLQWPGNHSGSKDSDFLLQEIPRSETELEIRYCYLASDQSYRPK